MDQAPRPLPQKKSRKVILFGGMFLIAAILTYGHTAVISWRLREALSSAQSVRLEAFVHKKVVAQRELDAREREDVLRALSIAPQFPVPLYIKMCFIPHHRMVVRDSRGGEAEYLICFSCDQYRFPGTGIRDMPPGWPAAVRRLYERHDLPLEPTETESLIRRGQ